MPKVGFALLQRLCDYCKHRQPGTSPPACKAFQRIPLPIRLMYFDHRNPHPDDNGIQFEPVDDKPETLAAIAKIKVRTGRFGY